MTDSDETVLNYLQSKYANSGAVVSTEVVSTGQLEVEFSLSGCEAAMVIETAILPMVNGMAPHLVRNPVVPRQMRRKILNRARVERHNKKRVLLSEQAHKLLDDALFNMGATAPQSRDELVNDLILRELKAFVAKRKLEPAADQENWTCHICKSEMLPAKARAHLMIKHG